MGARWIPVFSSIGQIRRSDIPGELSAGLSVAAIAIPIALAYSKILGVPTEAGLYATIAGGLAYAIFGHASRYLIVGPDTATCLVLAAAITTLGFHSPEDRAAAAAGLTLLAGIAFICASLLRLGFIASLISKPVLVGYLAGVSATLAIGQLSSITRVPLTEPGLLRPIYELATRESEIHWPSLLAGIATFILLRMLKRRAARLPGPAIAVIAAIALSFIFDLRAHGLSTIGDIPAGLPALRIPSIGGDPIEVAMATVGLLIVSFSSGILTARAFGAHLGFRNDVNQELAGLGISNIAAGLFQGFAITGADSRTAVGLNSGGKSALVGIFAAAVAALVATVLTAPLSLLPEAVLGAILLSAAVDLCDVKAFRALARVGRSEVIFAVIATAGVIWIGVLQGIFFAVLLTILHLLQLAARPPSFLVGRDPDSGSLVTLRRRPDAVQPKAIAIFLFESSIFFLNADWFDTSVTKALASRPDARWLVLDASAMMHADSDTVDAIGKLKEALNARGIRFMLGGGHGRFWAVLLRSGLADLIGPDMIFATPELALLAAEATRDAGVR
jgi:sulfate permease, SulP family